MAEVPRSPQTPLKPPFGEESGACRRGRNRSLLSSLDLSPASSYQPFFLPKPASNASGSRCLRRPLLSCSAGREPLCSPSALPLCPGLAGSVCDWRAKPQWDGTTLALLPACHLPDKRPQAETHPSGSGVTAAPATPFWQGQFLFHSSRSAAPSPASPPPLSIPAAGAQHQPLCQCAPQS